MPYTAESANHNSRLNWRRHIVLNSLFPTFRIVKMWDFLLRLIFSVCRIPTFDSVNISLTPSEQRGMTISVQAWNHNVNNLVNSTDKLQHSANFCADHTNANWQSSNERHEASEKTESKTGERRSKCSRVWILASHTRESRLSALRVLPAVMYWRKKNDYCFSVKSKASFSYLASDPSSLKPKQTTSFSGLWKWDSERMTVTQVATHLKIPPFVSQEGHGLLWGVKTFGVAWTVVVHPDSFGYGSQKFVIL